MIILAQHSKRFRHPSCNLLSTLLHDYKMSKNICKAMSGLAWYIKYPTILSYPCFS
jgi:hypothetical protein